MVWERLSVNYGSNLLFFLLVVLILINLFRFPKVKSEPLSGFKKGFLKHWSFISLIVCLALLLASRGYENHVFDNQFDNYITEQGYRLITNEDALGLSYLEIDPSEARKVNRFYINHENKLIYMDNGSRRTGVLPPLNLDKIKFLDEEQPGN